MSDTEDESFQGVEDALQQLNLSIQSYCEGEGDFSISDPQSDSSTTCARYAQSINWSTGPSMFEDSSSPATREHFPNITNLDLRGRLNTLHGLSSALPEHPYSVELYSRIATSYLGLAYPDLAAGAAYKALLLIDNLNDEDGEFHDQAFLSLAESISKQSLTARCAMLEKTPEIQRQLFHPEHCHRSEDGRPTFPVLEEEILVWTNAKFAHDVYIALAQCLHECGCERSAADYCVKGLQLFPDDAAFKDIQASIYEKVADHIQKTTGEKVAISDSKISAEQFPDQGMVRREYYPWNTFEPDRCSDESLEFLNSEMKKVAPKLEVRATELPALTEQAGTVKQLGVFASEDIAPGEIVLKETSLLTANNRLQDALCDACSADLPDMTDEAFSYVVECPECSVVFCNQTCFDLANDEYHPAVCDKGVEDIAKNVPPAEAANALYALLLLRALAMAETQECHPLDLKYVKYIWGDYHFADLSKQWESESRKTNGHAAFPLTLPFSFQANVVLPYNMLEMMDIDVFQNPQYDVWVFNTLYAKFRGTASARLSGLGGRPIRGPEVSAVHPNWCLANHSCDPNVTWNWSSEVKFRVLEERAQWKADESNLKERREAGIKKDQEVLSHYCDIDLPVQQRREWAAGSLGGPCCCDRCVWEAAHTLE